MAEASTMNLEQAMSVLDTMAKHWTINCVNSNGRRRYECTLWACGRRVTVSRSSTVGAILAAMDKVKQPENGPQLKLVK